jgi:hypothetical protein
LAFFKAARQEIADAKVTDCGVVYVICGPRRPVLRKKSRCGQRAKNIFAEHSVQNGPVTSNVMPVLPSIPAES